MSHHHDHVHPPHTDPPEISMEERLAKLLDHWIRHNEEHAESYETWAEKATSHGIFQVAPLLRAAAEKTRVLNDQFKEALKALGKLG